MDKTQLAFEFAKAAHRSINQKRKYTDEEYIVHPMRVYERLVLAGERNPIIFQAAYLHDVLEDVAPHMASYGPEQILEQFGSTVLGIVQELTDEFTREKYPELNREERKKREAYRLSTISISAMKVKLADLIDNTADITKHDPGFARVYLKEKKRVVEGMEPFINSSSDPILINLYNQVKVQLANS